MLIEMCVHLIRGASGHIRHKRSVISLYLSLIHIVDIFNNYSMSAHWI